MKIAGTITKQMTLTRRAAEIAIAVAMHESTLDPNAVNGPWVPREVPHPAAFQSTGGCGGTCRQQVAAPHRR